MINNRPKILETLPFYNHLPRAPFTYDASKLPVVLNFDIFDLCGLLPMTLDISNLCPDGIGVQPSDKVIEYYLKNNIKFQMVFVVANFYDIKLQDGLLTGKPYCFSLVPASVDGKVDEVDVRYANYFPLENIPSLGFIYLDFDPFTPGYGIFTSYKNFIGKNGLSTYTDSIGFIVNAYFLATSYNKDEVLLADMPDAQKFIREKYRQFRINHYFKPFKNIVPRRIWGADSPIELFLVQALASRNLYPQIQTLIFPNGEIFPSFFELITPYNTDESSNLITEVDFFFPEKRLAIFCDSTRHHRSKKSKEKDQRISNTLDAMGIKSLRIDGAEIVKSLERTVDIVEKAFSAS